MNGYFHRRLSPGFVETLQNNECWRNICNDPQLQPEIRNQKVTIYYQGRALIRELQLKRGQLIASVHHKFVPLQHSHQSKDLTLAWHDQTGFQFDDELKPQQLAHGETDVLKGYKRLMNFECGPEDLVQQAIITSAKNRILDQQVAFTVPGADKSTSVGANRIDLCHFDLSTGKIVFTEIKRVDDLRLFGPDDVPEVITQLRTYGTWIKREQATIRSAYSRVVELKRELGLGHRLRGVPDGELNLECKPLLVIGNCSLSEVTQIKKARRIRAGSKWDGLWSHLEDVACGLILCGKSGCVLTAGEQSPQKMWFAE